MTSPVHPQGAAEPAFAPRLEIVPATPSERRLVKRAKRLYAERRARAGAFGQMADLLGEPAWDLLLDLFVAHGEGRSISTSSACLAACVPPTTALRWIRLLEERELIELRADPRDGRRRFVRLTPGGLTLMRASLSAQDAGQAG